MSPTISIRACRTLHDELVERESLTPWAMRALAELKNALNQKPKRIRPRKLRGEAKRKASLAAVYEAVEKRADGKCEACGRDFVSWSLFRSPELDHFFGRANAESVESCWQACARCHGWKTTSFPSRAYWLKKFIAHAQRHGYAAEEERAAGLLAKLAAKGLA